MGFFKDFKRDFAQAVNELMPDKDELADEYDDEDMVNTFDENDNMDVAPEDMLEDLDDFAIDNLQMEEPKDTDTVPQTEMPEPDYDEGTEADADNLYADIPEAEIISEPEPDGDIVPEGFQPAKSEDVTVIPVTESAGENEVSREPDKSEEGDEQDELVALEDLDEANMLENVDEALDAESDTPDAAGGTDDELKNVNLSKDVHDAMMKREDTGDGQTDDAVNEEDSMAEVEARIEDREQEIDSILADDTTYITKGTTIKGNIETEGGVDIIGVVEGDVSCGGKLIVGGTIKGNVIAGEIYANAAKIEGEVVTEGSVKIGVGSVVVGNVSANSAVVAGAVNGDIDVHGPVIVDSTAVIMGNIKSRSVQINNGAVIEGFCSQCYSEIDVKSFFE